MRLLPLLWLLVACPQPPPAPEAPPPAEDRGELLTDVQHLVGEAAALHVAGRTTDAVAAWDRAYGIWHRHLATPMRQRDAATTVALEYALGQLRQELITERGRPKTLANRLDRQLEGLRPHLSATPPLPPTLPSTVPPGAPAAELPPP